MWTKILRERETRVFNIIKLKKRYRFHFRRMMEIDRDVQKAEAEGNTARADELQLLVDQAGEAMWIAKYGVKALGAQW